MTQKDIDEVTDFCYNWDWLEDYDEEEFNIIQFYTRMKEQIDYEDGDWN